MTAVETSDLSRRESFWTQLAHHWVARVLAIYAASRIISLGAFWLVRSRLDVREELMSPDAGFMEFLARLWDGSWYGIIAEDGYPSELPVDADGDVDFSPWAFFPIFPLLARLLMRVTGLSWNVIGPTLSVVLGAVAMLMLFKVIQQLAPGLVAERPMFPFAAVAAMSFFPAAGVFSLAYSDSLALILILSSLWCINRRRYLLAVVPVLLIGFTRAVALPVAAVVIWHVACRCRRDGFRSVPAKDWWTASVLCAVAVISGFSWMIVVGFALGSPDAYFQAQSPWRQRAGSSAPFAGWTWFIDTWVGWTMFAVFCVAIIALTFTPFVRRLGPELQAWGGASAGFLVAATALGASTPRYAMLTIMVPLAFVQGRRWTVLVVIAVSALLMGAWIYAVCMVEGFTP